MNNILPQSVRHRECKVTCFPMWHTRSILILYWLFSIITWNYALNLTITEQYAREWWRACDYRQIAGSELVPSDRQCNCVCCDERAPGNDRHFPWWSALNFFSPSQEAYTWGMRRYMSHVLPLNGQRNLHSRGSRSNVTKDFPSPEWDPHWLQRVDLKLRLCVSAHYDTANSFPIYTIFMPTGTMEKENTSRETTVFLLTA